MRLETKYQIECAKSLNSEELASFTMLYAPLISPLAAQLYLLMNAITSTHATIRNHRFLTQSLHCTPLELTAARQQLEQLLLVRTYENKEKNALIIECVPPKCGQDFLTHDVLGRYYLKQMGAKMHQFVTVCFASSQLSAEGYVEISAAFQSEKLNTWHEEDEAQYQKYVDSLPKDELSFDINAFLSGCSTLVFPNAARNKETCDLIAKLGTLYHVSFQQMENYVGRSMDLKNNRLKKTVFRKLILDAYQPLKQEVENEYHLSCLDFLTLKQNGIKPSKADARILEDLQLEYKLAAEVINVLIEYVLKVNDQKLDRSYIEKIAALWVRRNIDTLEKAQAECSAPAEKKTKKKETKKLPDWYVNPEEETKTEASQQLNEELEELLKKMG